VARERCAPVVGVLPSPIDEVESAGEHDLPVRSALDADGYFGVSQNANVFCPFVLDSLLLLFLSLCHIYPPKVLWVAGPVVKSRVYDQKHGRSHELA